MGSGHDPSLERISTGLQDVSRCSKLEAYGNDITGYHYHWAVEG